MPLWRQAWGTFFPAEGRTWFGLRGNITSFWRWPPNYFRCFRAFKFRNNPGFQGRLVFWTYSSLSGPRRQDSSRAVGSGDGFLFMEQKRRGAADDSVAADEIITQPDTLSTSRGTENTEMHFVPHTTSSDVSFADQSRWCSFHAKGRMA